MKFCPQCGTQLEDAAKFCRNCGSPIGTPEVPVQEPASEPVQTGSYVYEAPSAPAAEPAAPAAPSPTAPSEVPAVKKQSKAGIVAFILAFFFQGPAFVVGLVDVIRHDKKQKHGLAIAAIILSLVIMISTYFFWYNVTKSISAEILDSPEFASIVEDPESFFESLEDYIEDNADAIDEFFN